MKTRRWCQDLTTTLEGKGPTATISTAPAELSEVRTSGVRNIFEEDSEEDGPWKIQEAFKSKQESANISSALPQKVQHALECLDACADDYELRKLDHSDRVERLKDLSRPPTELYIVFAMQYMQADAEEQGRQVDHCEMYNVAMANWKKLNSEQRGKWTDRLAKLKRDNLSVLHDFVNDETIVALILARKQSAKPRLGGPLPPQRGSALDQRNDSSGHPAQQWHSALPSRPSPAAPSQMYGAGHYAPAVLSHSTEGDHGQEKSRGGSSKTRGGPKKRYRSHGDGKWYRGRGDSYRPA